MFSVVSVCKRGWGSLPPLYTVPAHPLCTGPNPKTSLNLFNLDLTMHSHTHSPDMFKTCSRWSTDNRKKGGWHSTEMPSCYRPHRSWGMVIFSKRVSRILFTGRGWYRQVPPGRYPPDRYTPLGRYPPDRYPSPRRVPPPPGRYTPQVGKPPRQVHPRTGTPPGQIHPRGKIHPPGRYTPHHGQWAGGMHPTGMHSCFPHIIRLSCLTLFHNRSRKLWNY